MSIPGGLTTFAPANPVTPPLAATNGCGVSAKNPASDAPTARVNTGCHSPTRSSTGISPARTPLESHFSWASTPCCWTKPAFSSRPISMDPSGGMMSWHSSAPVANTTFPPHWNAPAPETVHTFGFFLRTRLPPPSHANWGRICSPRHSTNVLASASQATTGFSQIRIPFRAVVLATSLPYRFKNARASKAIPSSSMTLSSRIPTSGLF